MRSIVVWRRPSQLPISDCAPTAFTPSVESMVPLASWSIPRPPLESVTGAPAVRSTVYVPSAPPPWPTTSMAIVATPACASEEATSHGAPFLLSPNPWPKIAVGQPPAGVGPAGRKSANWM